MSGSFRREKKRAEFTKQRRGKEWTCPLSVAGERGGGEGRDAAVASGKEPNDEEDRGFSQKT